MWREVRIHVIWDSHNITVVGKWVDEATGQYVRWVVWYDDVACVYEAFRSDPHAALRAGIPLREIRYRGKARLWLEPEGVARECAESGCRRRAIWSVADCQDLAPVLRPDGLPFVRREVTGQRHYCDLHWRPPTVVSVRGVTSEVTEVVQP